MNMQQIMFEVAFSLRVREEFLHKVGDLQILLDELGKLETTLRGKNKDIKSSRK